jgi:hypothetical protein
MPWMGKEAQGACLEGFALATSDRRATVARDVTH